MNALLAISQNLHKLCFGTLTLAAVLGAPVAHANAVLFDPSGAGNVNAVAMADSGLYGNGFVTTIGNTQNASQFYFIEQGAYHLSQTTFASVQNNHDITALYSVIGIGTLGSTQLSFVGGSVALYADSNFNFGTASPNSPVVFGANDGTQIATFAITGGGGYAGVGAQVQGQAVTGSVAQGYFFAQDGSDLAQSGAINVSLNIANSIDYVPSATVVSEIVCKASQFPGAGCDGTPYANSPYYFTVADAGTVTLTTSVPEPTTGVLISAGLIALAAVRRIRRS